MQTIVTIFLVKLKSKQKLQFFLNILGMAARLVLNDWNNGKIKYFTHPPETETKETHVSAEIVTEFAKEFDLQGLDKMDQDDMSDLPAVLPSETMKIDTSGILEGIKQEESMDTESSDDDDENENEENIGGLSKRTAMLVEAKKSKVGPDTPKFQAEGLAKMKKAAKIREKKEKKDRRRRDKVATELSNDLENALGALGSNNEKYEFDKDFEM